MPGLESKEPSNKITPMNTDSDLTHTVRAKHSWYSRNDTYAYEFRGTLAECKEYVKDCESAVYYLSHNEIGRPVYSIVRIDNLGKYARMEAERALTAAEIKAW